MDADSRDLLQQALSRLDAGLFVQNLEQLISLLKPVVVRSDGFVQLSAWVVEGVLADLLSYWDDRCLPTVVYERATAELTPLLRDALERLVEDQEPAVVTGSLERLVAGFVGLEAGNSLTA